MRLVYVASGAIFLTAITMGLMFIVEMPSTEGYQLGSPPALLASAAAYKRLETEKTRATYFENLTQQLAMAYAKGKAFTEADIRMYLGDPEVYRPFASGGIWVYFYDKEGQRFHVLVFVEPDNTISGITGWRPPDPDVERFVPFQRHGATSQNTTPDDLTRINRGP